MLFPSATSLIKFESCDESIQISSHVFIILLFKPYSRPDSWACSNEWLLQRTNSLLDSAGVHKAKTSWQEKHLRFGFRFHSSDTLNDELEHQKIEGLTYQTRSRSSVIVRERRGESSWPSSRHRIAASWALALLSIWRQHSATFKTAPGNHLPPGQGSPWNSVSSLFSIHKGRLWNFRLSSSKTISQ